MLKLKSARRIQIMNHDASALPPGKLVSDALV